MPASVTVTRMGRTCHFRESDHRYWLDDMEESPLVSVTTLIHELCAQPFDAEAAARRECAKRGIDPAQWRLIQTEWDVKRDAACRKGTRVHETAEDCLRGNAPRHAPESEEERARFHHAWDMASRVRAKARSLQVETLLFAPGSLCAGTADLIADLGDKVVLLDWKTNEDLFHAAFSAMRPPFSHLPDDSLTRYALQLSCYRQLALRGGAAPHGRKWVHALLCVRADGCRYVPVPYYPDEAACLLGMASQTGAFRESEPPI